MDQGTGEKFKEIAEELFDGKKADLARAIGMKPGSFSKYTSGETMPGGNILKRLLDIGINLNWFLGDVPPMYIEDIKHVQTARVNSRGEEPEQENGRDPNHFNETDQENILPAEHRLLKEVKHFSNYFKSRPLSPNAKRLLLEQLINSTDQTTEEPHRDRNGS